MLIPWRNVSWTVVRSCDPQGRLFDLSIQHLPYSPEPLEAQVRNAVELLIDAGHSGDTLVFLPGAVEIRRAMRACDAVARRAGHCCASSAWKPAAQGAGPGALASVSAETDSCHQCGGKLGHGRGRDGRHRQWIGALRDIFSLERVADASRRPSEQGFGEAASGAGGADCAGPRAATLHRRGLLAPPGAGCAGDSAQRSIAALSRSASDGDRPRR